MAAPDDLTPASTEEAEPSIAQKLKAKLDTDLFALNKLDGITLAAIRVEEARNSLVNNSKFETSHSLVKQLDKVLSGLEKYAD